jgi:hypothetical protein
VTIPFFHDQIEVLKDNLPDLAPQGRFAGRLIYGNLRHVKRAVIRRPSTESPSGVDEGQIIEALRLTPTERLQKAWRYSAFALELRRATEIYQRDGHARMKRR